jgi:serine/threonine-protein kinase
VVGRFVVERLLARAGMGEAYLARDPLTGGAVLLKLPRTELLDDVAVQARFEREAEALRRLRHPGVQRWIDCGWDGRRPFVALEYVEGETLRCTLQRRGRLVVSEALALAIDLADALACCHRHGVVHRDLKPENVIVTPAGRPVLIDFGSAILAGARRLTFSQLTGELGTPQYMAPEQVQGRRGDRRTDVYALGTLLYELLAGHPPFAPRAGESAVHVMRRHLEEVPLPPAAEGLDELLQGAIARALRRDPDDRFQTMEAFRHALADPQAAATRGDIWPGWTGWPAVSPGPPWGGLRLRSPALVLATVVIIGVLVLLGAALAAGLLRGA